MIRINLLPTRQAMKAQQGRIELALFAGIIVLEVLFLGLLYLSTSGELSELEGRVNTNKAAVAEAEGKVKDANQLNEKADKLKKQIGVLKELEKSRTGPVQVLDELQAMLSPPRNEEDRFAQLQKNWNVDWDTSRLWVREFTESEGVFQMSGGAVNADDVAEFFQRLTTAKHFKRSKLAFVRATTSGKGGGPRLVDFEISGVLTYTGELPKAKATGKKKKKRKR